jgi:hypothetical protein
MDDIEKFFSNSIRRKDDSLDWWENKDQKYTEIIASVNERMTWHRATLVPDKKVICPDCGRDDRWKLGGNQSPNGIVMLCEHHPVDAGRYGVRNLVTIPFRFVRSELLKCCQCNKFFADCNCVFPDMDFVDLT